MAEYNINEIELESEDNSKEIPELLTGEEIKGLPAKSPITPNIEVERNEFIQFPDGTVQKVDGESHEKGGAKMKVPDGTKVISNNLKLTSSQVKTLKKEFDIEVSTKDTYATAIDRYTRKIGLKKLNEEQEDVFKELQRTLEKKGDTNTLKVNQEYLSKKIYNLEQSKLPKEKERSNFFNVVFDMQESTKKPTSNDGTMKYGGMSKANFEAMCKKMGMDPEKAMTMMEDGGEVEDKELPMYVDGGEEPFSGTFKVSEGRHSYSNEEQYRREQQKRTAGAFGNVGERDIDQVLQGLYENFPDIITRDEVFGKTVKVENGKVSFTKGLDFSKKIKEVKKFQELANDRMNASADIIIANPETFGEEQVKSAEQFKKTQTFDQSTARGFDSALGNFTSGRYNVGLDVVSPTEKENLAKQGIYTINQLKDQDISKLGLSAQSISRANKLIELQKQNPKADFRIDTYNVPQENIPTIPETKKDEKDKTTTAKEGEIRDLVKKPQGTNYPRLFFTPDQSVLPPSPMEAHLKNDIRLQRIDPVRIGIENNLQEISDQRQFVTDQLNQLPESQRAAALSNLLATSQDSANKAITAANVTNAQNVSQAELFNINQSGQEQLYAANNAIDFERRQLTAKAKTEEELRRYYDFNRKVNLNNFQNQQRLNMLDSLFPNATLDPFGMTFQYEETPFELEDRSALLWAYQNGVLNNQGAVNIKT